jgi:glycosyltransferase involved in cell wall biosynthesis
LTPYISVIVPAYNAELYLRQTLNSLLAQSFNNFEVIIIDDGSIDDTSIIIKEFLHDTRFKLITQKNGGLSAARNVGIQTSSGTILAFLDSDDLYHKDYLSSIAKFHKTYPEVNQASFSRLMYIDHEGRLLYPYSFGYPYKLTFESFIDCPLLPVAVSLKKESLNGDILFDEEYTIAEDYELWTRLAELGMVFSPLANTLVFYRYRPSSMMFEGMHRYNENFSKIQHQLLKKIDSEIHNKKALIVLTKRKLTALIMQTMQSKQIIELPLLDCNILSDSTISEVTVHAITRSLIQPWSKWITEIAKFEKSLKVLFKSCSLSTARINSIVDQIINFDSPLNEAQYPFIRQNAESLSTQFTKIGVFGAGRQALKIVDILKAYFKEIIFIDECPLSNLEGFKVIPPEATHSVSLDTVLLSSPNHQSAIVKKCKQTFPEKLPLYTLYNEDGAQCLT